MSSYNITSGAASYNTGATQVATRPHLPFAKFVDNSPEGVDGGNEQLASALRVVHARALTALAPLVGERAAQVGAVAAEHALVSSLASLRCNWPGGYNAPGHHVSRNSGRRPLVFGAGFHDAFIAAYRVFQAEGLSDPMTTGRAACAATNEARNVDQSSLVVVEAFTQAAVAGARAALAASKVGT